LSNTFYSFKFSLLVFFIGIFIANAQEDDWDSYLAEAEKGLMSVHVNFKYVFAKPNYKNLVLVGTKTKKCFKNGAPNTEGLDEIYAFSDSVAVLLNQITKNKLAGILTYQCAGFDVYYVKDTIDIRNKINGLIQRSFSNTRNYLVIRRDKRWDYYEEVLYPKDISDNFFANQEYLNQLFYEGKDLSKKIKVTHWSSFKKDKRRQKFIDKVKVLNFKIDSLKFNKDNNYPFEAKIYRENNLNPTHINEITKVLDSLSRSYGGYYDGWSADFKSENRQ